MKIASIVLFVLALASLALTATSRKSTKAQLARVQSQLADEDAHASALQHALQAERVANNEYLEKTKKSDETRDACMRVARDLDVVPIDEGVRKSAIDAYKSLRCAESDPAGREGVHAPVGARERLARRVSARLCQRTARLRQM